MPLEDDEKFLDGERRRNADVGRFWGVRESTMLTTEKNKAIMECFAPLLYCTPRDVNIGKIETELTLAILDKKLAASVNILPKASSLYFWNGEIEEATEILLLIKTKTSKVRMLSSYVRLVHPFEIPEVFSLPMDQGDVHYLKWLEEGMEED